MVNKEELFDQVVYAISEVLNTDDGEITPESMLQTDLGAESIDMLDISFEIENTTEVELNFQEVVDYIESKKRQKIKDLSVSDVVDYVASKK